MYICGTRTILDEITDADVVAERVPRLGRHFSGIQDVRKAIEEATVPKMGSTCYGLTRGGTMMRVANMPISVWAATKQIDQHWARDKRKFYAWLRRHPEYRVGKQVSR